MKHSDLVNPNDLHFAKFRTFAGNPLAIAPDFANQILSAIDTNKIYRATGTTLGAMVELIGASDGGGGSPPTFASLIDFGYPDIEPSALGVTYFDTESLRLFVARDLNSNGWIPTENKIDFQITISNTSSIPNGDLRGVILYSPTLPSANEDLADILLSGVQVSDVYDQNSNLCKAIARRGKGYYFFGYEYIGTQDPVPSLSTGMFGHSTYSSSGFFAFQSDFFAEGLTYKGLPIGGAGIRFNQYPVNRRTDSGNPFAFELVIIDG